MRISRRELLAGAGAVSAGLHLNAQSLQAMTHCPIEWSFNSAKPYGNPFEDVELDVLVQDPDGVELEVPAFWAGSSNWRVRYAPSKPGTYRWRTRSTDPSDKGLHGQSGTITATAYAGTNPLYQHGPLRVSKDRRHFEHADGTPFFWLGDTWWMGLVKRLAWPDDFQLLAADRQRKGFTAVQIVAGLYPDMPERDPRGANEAGFPYDDGYREINPAYFDMADMRIRHIVASGLVPCIVGCWGYYLPILGVQKMKRHWRYLIARWGAYPAVWCLAGEGTMPYYLSKHPDQDAALQKAGWTEIARYVRVLSAHRNLITIHPSSSARVTVEDPAVLDFDMLQTGHGDRESIPSTMKLVTTSYQSSPSMPVLIGEVCYEGIQEASRQEIQRFMFWASMLSGAAGHTYGANGIWQVNNPGEPFGASPHGRSWGDTPWQTAYRLPGLSATRHGEGAACEIRVVAHGAAPGMDRAALVGTKLHAAALRWDRERIAGVLFPTHQRGEPQDSAAGSWLKVSRVLVESSQRQGNRSWISKRSGGMASARAAYIAGLCPGNGNVAHARGVPCSHSCEHPRSHECERCTQECVRHIG